MVVVVVVVVVVLVKLKQIGVSTGHLLHDSVMSFDTSTVHCGMPVSYTALV